MTVKTVVSMDGMQKILEEIRDSLATPKENLSVVVSSETTDWTTFFSPALHLDPQKRYEMALVNLESYNSIPNITATNNTFVYSPDDGTSWKQITLPEGSYEISQINTAIRRQLEVNGDWNADDKSHYIAVGANPSTLRAFIEISNSSYQVNLTTSAIKSILGFNPQTLGIGYHEGENTVDILSVHSILVNCDIINGSFLRGGQQPVIYSFFPNVPPGYKVVESPNNLVYLPVSKAGNINCMRVWLTDQSGSQLDLRGETVSIRFHIRSV